MPRPFTQVDVFSSEPFRGNPVAVVLDGAGLATEQMQVFARWMNLSETTFLIPPTDPAADYQVRIFTPGSELPFAGHPTLGTCHAWLTAGHAPARKQEIVQQCGAGLVRIRRTADGLGFAAPPLVRFGPVDEPLIQHTADQLGIARAQIVDAHWADNGPGWIGVLLGSADEVLALRPVAVQMDLGVAGPYPAGSECDFEVRAFFQVDGQTTEDPVTGSFNASLAQWLLSSGRATAPYVVSQGTMVGRRGRVFISHDQPGADAGREGTIWVAGSTVTRITGVVDI
jgi:PhzF family phenazine biosynthesis protein